MMMMPEAINRRHREADNVPFFPEERKDSNSFPVARRSAVIENSRDVDQNGDNAAAHQHQQEQQQEEEKQQEVRV